MMEPDEKISLSYDEADDIICFIRNCSYYAISRTFTKEEIEAMDDKTISLLIRLADRMSEILY